MNDLDKRIQEALRGDKEGESLIGEPNLMEEMLAAFRGRNKWINGIAFVDTLVLFAIAVWGAIRFYRAEAVEDQLFWGGVCLLGMLFVGFLKTYFWLQMSTNRVLREIKRVELLFLQRQK